MSRKRLGPSTTAIHGVPQRAAPGSSVGGTIAQTSTFAFATDANGDVMYTRYGNNPNQVDLAERLRLLEGAEAALFTASGMSATALAHLAILRPGDHLVASDWIYGGTRRLFDTEFAKFGIEVTYVPPTAVRAWKRALRKTTRAVFVESPSNPHLRVLDLAPLATLCHQRGLALLIDATFASPINFRPLEHGADVVIHSATKYLNGHSDVTAGAIASSTEVIDEARRLLQLWGPALDPHAAWLLARGLKTLDVRMERHNRNAQAFAEWAAGDKRIAAVHYPGLPAHPDHALAARILNGFGGMVGLVVSGGAARSSAVIRRLKIACHAPSLGGVETLVSEPRLTSHAAMTSAQRAAQGIPDGFIRVSVGLEDVDDLIADFRQALKTTA
ncbi:MAG: PLP-dependent aspartate aminotransferase family protein [Gemmatimonadales bacterium]